VQPTTARDHQPLLDPLREALDRVERGDWLSGSGSDRWEPELWCDETDRWLTLNVALPGARPEDVRVRVAGDLLTIEADRRHDEQRQGSGFVRSFLLPGPVPGEAIDAALRDGTLLVTVDKGCTRRPRRVPIA
jgi:HSP20 family molecular chaperone IbpA